MQANWQKELDIYTRDATQFMCPAGKNDKSDYSFNIALENMLMELVAEPSRTISFYEGKNQEFDFRHSGQTKTNIAFADGHVKAFTKEELKIAFELGAARWKP